MSHEDICIDFALQSRICSCSYGECDELSICYSVKEEKTSEPNTKQYYCLPCWYRYKEPDVTISDAAMAIGETVWCDEKDRPQLFGPIGVCLSMLTAWAPQRDVSLLNALVRLSASTDVVRWSNIRPKITGLAKHPRCVQAVSQNEGSVRFRINSAEGAWIAGPSTHVLIQAALCSDDVDLQKQSSRDVAQILVPLYTLGNFARASEFESLIGRAESPDDDDDGKEPTAWTSVLRSRLEAACILGDRGLFYSNLKRWYAARETAGNHQPVPQLMLSAVQQAERVFRCTRCQWRTNHNVFVVWTWTRSTRLGQARPAPCRAAAVWR